MKRYLILLIVPLLFYWGCEEKKNDPVAAENTAKVASCEGCHTNYTHLKAVHTPDPPSSGGGGCGGETPHIEPYDRVYLGGEGYTAFKNSLHGKLECTVCHNGNDKTADKNVAHSGEFIKKPSAGGAEKCRSCHGDIVARAKNSIHAEGWGQKNTVSMRSGNGNVPEGFERLTEEMKKGYSENCGKCHASCGDCHVNRPKAGGGGLYKGHMFLEKPDMVDHCTTCHTSRGGHAFFGVAPGTVPDVHLSKAGFQCVSCHTKNEVHGDGKMYDQRYKMALLPECTDCHTGAATSNKFHINHIKTFSCQTCHSQEYNNCGSCHIGGEGARIHSYQGYKIGLNPIPETRPYKFALLRQSLTAPDSWMNYGISTLSNFSAQPTYKYTTPHNIVKITTRTGFKNSEGKWEVNNDCASGCHISKNPDGTLKNKELYLFDENLLDWEKAANTNIVVDGKLPQTWVK